MALAEAVAEVALVEVQRHLTNHFDHLLCKVLVIQGVDVLAALLEIREPLLNRVADWVVR